jgi:hypothetical protein
MKEKSQESTYGRLADELHNYNRNGSRSKPTESRPKGKKSLIPKPDNSTGFNPEVAAASASPEVKNAVKDIIKLLKGLDKISGGPQLSEVDEDDPNCPGNQEGREEPQRQQPIISGGSSGSTARPVRVSNIGLRHEDPKYMRISFETFESGRREHTESKVILPQIQNQEPSPPQNSQKSIKLNSFQSKTSDSPSRKNINDLIKIRPLKAVHEFRSKEQLGISNSRKLKNSPSDEVVPLINSYRSNDNDEAGAVEEERFYSFKHTNVYREPSLSIFLPSENTQDTGRDGKLYSYRSSSNTYDTALPANFGAPYFRLDGSIMEDVNFSRFNYNNYVNINSCVKSAVQEQQSLYKEATNAAKHLKKKLIKTDSTAPQSKPKSKPTRRQMF